VGGSGASCTEDGIQISISYASIPGMGVVTAQSSATSRDIAIQKVYDGESPNFIINYFQTANKEITLEQYGIITHDAKEYFTGVDSTLWAGAMVGDVNGFEYSFQGNSLTSARAGFQATSAFEDANFKGESASVIARGCEMAWRLFRAVQAGGMNGEGDNRCTGRAGTSAYIRVDLNDGIDAGVFYEGNPGETKCYLKSRGYDSSFCGFTQRAPHAYLSIEIPTHGDVDPLLKLDELFKAWAETNNCYEDGNSEMLESLFISQSS